MSKSSMRPIFFPIAGAIFLILGVLFFSPQLRVSADDLAVSATEEKILVSLAQDTPTWLSDHLYSLDPDGSNLTPYFDFTGQPKQDTGRILGLHQGDDGKHVYFHSTFLAAYTPAGRNVFQLTHANKSLDQVTPGPNSGDFSQTGNSIVSGRTEDGAGVGYSGAPVFLEGVGTVNTGGDGAFSFTKVPPGARWLVAYNNTLDRFEARVITVVANLNITSLTLVPTSNTRMNFQFPVPYNDRIYYVDNFGVTLNWTDVDFAGPTTVYQSLSGVCSGFPTVDAFDVSRSGKIVIYDYQTGCGIGNTDHVGLYTLDSDGGNKQILKDMLNDQVLTQWDDPIVPAEIFWSPDETKIAVKVSYGSVDNIVIFDASNGALLGSAATNTTTATVTLHGWSPDGNWLLFSEYDGDATKAILGKIVVNGDGSMGAVTTLLTDQPISSATWGNIEMTTNPTNPTPTPTTPPTIPADHSIYLPLIVR